MRKLALVLWLVTISAAADAQTFWVKPTGSDTHNCLTPKRACATWQGAYDKAVRINFKNRTVAIRSVPGVHKWTVADGDLLRISKAWQGGGTLRITGDVATPSNVVLSAGNGSVFRTGGGLVAGTTMTGGIIIEGFRLLAPKGYGLRHAADGDVALGAMEWDRAATHYGTEWFSARIRAFSTHTIVDDAEHHVDIDAGRSYLFNKLVINGARNFHCFVRSRNMGYVVLDWKIVLNGSVSGHQVCIRENAAVSAQGVEIPGDRQDIKSGGVFIQ
jgi:hypothetical protein